MLPKAEYMQGRTYVFAHQRTKPQKTEALLVGLVPARYDRNNSRE